MSVQSSYGQCTYMAHSQNHASRMTWYLHIYLLKLAQWLAHAPHCSWQLCIICIGAQHLEQHILGQTLVVTLLKVFFGLHKTVKHVCVVPAGGVCLTLK